MPKLRADIRLPSVINGGCGPFSYIASDVKVVLEITPKQPERQRAPVPSSRQGESSIAWDSQHERRARALNGG
jgi:hypothetical protein